MSIVQRGHFADEREGFLTCRLFDAKKIGFFKIYVVFARTKEVEPVRSFSGEGERSIFRDFVLTSIMADPLRIKSYIFYSRQLVWLRRISEPTSFG